MNNTVFSKQYHRIVRRPILWSLAILMAALLPRLAAVERYVTPDELIWVYRAINFREALRAGMWADTLLAGHPGVVTMWLGAVSASIQLLINPADQEIYQWITKIAWMTPDNMTAFQQLNAFLTSGRLAAALVNSFGIILVFWMTRRLLGDVIALLMTAFLILDPFLAGLSGLMHVDGLATTFVTISLISLALTLQVKEDSEQQKSSLLFAVLSGSSAALAVLAKSPALLLIPVTGLIFLFSLLINREPPFWKQLRHILPFGFLWLASFILVLFLVFPALWTSPLQVFQTASSNANRHVQEALRPTFFLGTVAFDHGYLFYPISLAWRLGPLVTVGVLILLVLLLQRDQRSQLPKLSILILLLWIVAFLAGISLAAKKFDRYMLPVIPALTLLAAIGWAAWIRPEKRTRKILLTVLLIVQFLYMVYIMPYPLAGYNLLLGGPISAEYVLPVGWGESISSAGSWLANEPRAETKKAISGIAPSLAPFFAGETLLAADNSHEAADYVIFTANSRQVDPEGVEQATRDLSLLKVIRYAGRDQSWIYVNNQPQSEFIDLEELPHPISFDSKMQLLSQDIESKEGELQFTGRWRRQQSSDRFLVKLRLVDSNNLEWSELETPLLNEYYFLPIYWEQEETPIITYRLKLPPAIPPDIYRVELSLVDEATGSQLPALAVGGTFQGVQYYAGDMVQDLPVSTPKVSDLDMISAGDVTWEDGSIRLLGSRELPDRVIAGGELILDLYWQSMLPLEAGLQASFQVNDDSSIEFPISRYDSGLWQPGTIIQEKYRLLVPPELDDGHLSLAIKPLLADGSGMDGSRYVLGNVEIQGVDRITTLPENIAVPINALFEQGISLRGMEPGDVSIMNGEALTFTLIWQTEGKTEEPVTAFVHLIDDQGNIVAQVDRWPGGLPSNTWALDQVILDEYILETGPDFEPGRYEIVVGLYIAGTGHRLKVQSSDGMPLLNDSVLLPSTVTIGP